jgi:glutaredoxin
MASVTLYTRARCHLCDVAKDVIASVRAERPFDFEALDVDSHPDWKELYGHEVPVVFVNGRKAFKYRVAPEELRERLERMP